MSEAAAEYREACHLPFLSINHSEVIFEKHIIVPTDNEAFESICRVLGLRANKLTLGVQLVICLHHISISTSVFLPFGRY